MSWLSENLVTIISILFGAGGIGFAITERFLNRKKYKQEVRQESLSADIKSDEFWKNRYDVLDSELKDKDNWWKERYDNLYHELQEERKLSNEIIKNFRTELNEIREEYEQQREIDRRKYNELLEQYRDYQEKVENKNIEQMNRINQLENLVSEYEKKLNR